MPNTNTPASPGSKETEGQSALQPVKEPRFKTLEEIRHYTDRHPPYFDGDYNQLDRWVQETWEYIKTQGASK